jgi:protein-disulfide isomerase
MKKLLLFVILFLAASASLAQDKRYDVPVGDSPVLGPADAPVTIIEFLDFQ